MKCQTLFSGKYNKRKYISNFSSDGNLLADVKFVLLQLKYIQERIITSQWLNKQYRGMVCVCGRGCVEGKPVPLHSITKTCLYNVDSLKPYFYIVKLGPASVVQLDAPSDWRPGGRGFDPRKGRQHSFVEIDHEIFSTVIFSLPLIQEGSCQFLAKECAQYWLTA